MSSTSVFSVGPTVRFSSVHRFAASLQLAGPPTAELLEVPVVMGVVVLLFLAEIVCQVTEDRGRIRRPTLKGRDTTGAAPAITALHADNDVLVEESAFFEESDSGLGCELIRPELANADEV